MDTYFQRKFRENYFLAHVGTKIISAEILEHLQILQPVNYSM